MSQTSSQASSSLPTNIRLRIIQPPISAADEEFLVALYGSTREQELAALPWDAAQREAFVRFQHTAQLRYYQNQFPKALHQIIMLDTQQPIGRIYVDRREREIRILDLSLLPQHCGQGIGSRLLGELMIEASQSNKSLSIYLELHSRSQSLFERLGFKLVEESGAHLLFEWLSDSISARNLSFSPTFS